jgi:hypothetical protein
VRTFGDRDDPDGPVRRLLTARRHQVLKPQTGNGPQLYYLL